MAIAFDASSSLAFENSSATLSHTTSGSNRLLVVVVYRKSLGAEVNSITYGGVAMTFLNGDNTAHYPVSAYYLVAPASGANDIVVTLVGSTNGGILAASYTGVDQGAPPTDGSNVPGNDDFSPYGVNYTTSTDNSLIIFASADDHAVASARTPVAGTTERFDIVLGSSVTFGGFFSDRITTTAGSYAMTYTDASVSESTNVSGGFLEFIPAPTTSTSSTSSSISTSSTSSSTSISTSISTSSTSVSTSSTSASTSTSSSTSTTLIDVNVIPRATIRNSPMRFRIINRRVYAVTGS